MPENSLAAFEAAIAIGAGIECDVRLSGDNSAIVFHDGDLKRLCDVTLTVECTPAALLTGQRLADSNQYVPALWKVLDLVRGRVPLLLELKTRDGNSASLCQEVLLDVTMSQGAVGVMSFDPWVGWWFSRNGPHVTRGSVIRHDLSALKRWFALLVARPQFLAVEEAALRRRWAERARRRMPVYSWTIRTAGQRRQAAVHADALIWEGDG